jgi:uncharacterized pyridoxal phosphate-containing UPF0001 family protein
MTGPGGVVEAAGFEARLAEARHRIDTASSDPTAVRVVAVTKGFGVAAVRLALGAGLTAIGENYADELVAKAGQLAGGEEAAGQLAGGQDAAGQLAGGQDATGQLAGGEEATGQLAGGEEATGQLAGGEEATGQLATPEWHYLGAVQRNKVARLAPVVSCWQGLSRREEGEAIARRHPGATVLVQVNVSGLPGRGGCAPDGVPELVAGLRDQPLEVAGLMAVGPPGPPEAARPGFALVSRLADALDLPVRSMGMSDDLEVALSEGSTMVRLGRALFGDRPPRPG